MDLFCVLAFVCSVFLSTVQKMLKKIHSLYCSSDSFLWYIYGALAFVSQPSINRLTAPLAYRGSSKCMKTSKKSILL